MILMRKRIVSKSTQKPDCLIHLVSTLSFHISIIRIILFSASALGFQNATSEVQTLLKSFPKIVLLLPGWLPQLVHIFTCDHANSFKPSSTGKSSNLLVKGLSKITHPGIPSRGIIQTIHTLYNMILRQNACVIMLPCHFTNNPLICLKIH